MRHALLALALLAGCSQPVVRWDDRASVIEPVAQLRSGAGLLIVRTLAREGTDGPERRGFNVLDVDGHLLHQDRGRFVDWSGVRLFPGRYVVISPLGDPGEGRFVKAQVVIEEGRLTAVDFAGPPQATSARSPETKRSTSS